MVHGDWESKAYDRVSSGGFVDGQLWYTAERGHRSFLLRGDQVEVSRRADDCWCGISLYGVVDGQPLYGYACKGKQFVVHGPVRSKGYDDIRLSCDEDAIFLAEQEIVFVARRGSRTYCVGRRLPEPWKVADNFTQFFGLGRRLSC